VTHQPEVDASIDRAVAQQQSAELAAHIAAVLAHPATPTCLYNAMVDELEGLYAEVSAAASRDSAEEIARMLNWRQGRGFREGGESR